MRDPAVVLLGPRAGRQPGTALPPGSELPPFPLTGRSSWAARGRVPAEVRFGAGEEAPAGLLPPRDTPHPRVVRESLPSRPGVLVPGKQSPETGLRQHLL